GAGVGDHDDVLDPGSPATGEVHARLDAEGHTWLEEEVVAGDDVRLLVDLQTDAVAGPVHEHLAVPGLGDQVTRGRVDRLRGHTWTHRVHGRLLGGLQDRVRLWDVSITRFADRIGASGVRVVPVRERSADVDDDHVARLDHPVRQRMVRTGAVGSG